MGVFTLILDTQGTPLDISSYIMQKTDIIEQPVYTNGTNVGTAKTGNPIFDRLNTRYKFAVPLKPLPQSILQQIDEKCRLNEMSITYTSYTSGANVTKIAQCSLSASNYALSKDERIYHGSVITCDLKA